MGNCEYLNFYAPTVNDSGKKGYFRIVHMLVCTSFCNLKSVTFDPYKVHWAYVRYTYFLNKAPS